MSGELTLVTKLEEMQLVPEQRQTLLDSFGDLFVEAHKLVAQGKGIVVTREDQTAEMAQAKTIRIQLMKIRTQAEKTKKMIKEPYLRGAQAAQDIYNDIKKITEPEEGRLEQQEKFAELAEQVRTEKRLAAEKRKELQIENEKLKKAAEDAAIVEKMRQDEADKKIKRAEEAREKAERILAEQKKKEQDRLDEIARIEAQEEARKVEEANKALFAPDKEKLVEFAALIDKIVLPAVASRDAQLIIQEAEVLLTRASDYIREKAKAL